MDSIVQWLCLSYAEISSHHVEMDQVKNSLNKLNQVYNFTLKLVNYSIIKFCFGPSYMIFLLKF